MKNDAKQWLEIAIERHERHMSGQEPTTGKEGELSQKLMMDEMKMALKSIILKEPVGETDWYRSNKDKVNSSEHKSMKM